MVLTDARVFLLPPPQKDLHFRVQKHSGFRFPIRLKLDLKCNMISNELIIILLCIVNSYHILMTEHTYWKLLLSLRICCHHEHNKTGAFPLV